MRLPAVLSTTRPLRNGSDSGGYRLQPADLVSTVEAVWPTLQLSRF